MKAIPREWMSVDHKDILRNLNIERQSPDGIEAIAKMYRWEQSLKPRLNGGIGCRWIREPHEGEGHGMVYCVATLGPEISQELNFMTENGQLYDVTLLDALSDGWLLAAVQRQFEVIAQTCRQNGWGMSTRKMPGDKAPLAMAAKIVESLCSDTAWVTYQEPGFMEPIKSLAYFYEISLQGEVPLHDEECVTCSRENCIRRQRKIAVEIITAEDVVKLHVSEGAILHDVLQGCACAPDAPCGGRGVCGKCTVEIQTESDQRQRVLSCKYTIRQPLKVWVPEGESWQMAFDPCEVAPMQGPYLYKTPVQTYFSGGETGYVCLEALLGTNKTHARDTEGWFLCRENTVFGFTPHDSAVIGAAIDLGSTTIAVRTFDMESGEIISSEGIANPLRVFGADILSRLSNSTGDQNMTRMLRQRIEQMLGRHEPSFPSVIAIAGNNAMAQIFLGLCTEGLAMSPYWHWLTRTAAVPMGDIWPDRVGQILVMPAAGTFTGGDLVSGLVHCGIHKQKEKTLYLDLGTNGEMACGNSDGVIVTAAAAGPAFENMEGASGVGSVPGAITQVQLLGQDRWHFKTIGDVPPIGVCGSGIISLISELLRHRMLDSAGTLMEELEGEVFLHPGITLSQNDIRGFQMAKSALRSGVELLLDKRGWTPPMLDRIIVAGGFSRDILPQDLISVGILPPCAPEKIQLVGNSSLGGVSGFLLNKGVRDAINQCSQWTESVNLGETPEFETLFINHINF